MYISLFVHKLISKAICSECEDFCLQLCFFGKRKNITHQTFHILKKNHILKMKAHSETHFENENSCISMQINGHLFDKS